MRLRYQLVVAILVVTLMVTCFLAGRQFQTVAALLPAKPGGSARLVSGVLAGGASASAAESVDDVSLRPLETFQEVLTHIRKQYVSPIKSERELTYGAIRGLLSTLREPPYDDRYSRFLDPEEYRSFLEENEGHFGGIGAELGVREVKIPPSPSAKAGEAIRCPVCGTDVSNPKQYQVVIIAPLPDSPAERAGLRAGDHILRVNDAPTANLALADTVRRIKGPPGTAVNLVISRERVAEPLTIKVTRAVISVRSAEYKPLPGHVGYLRVSTFNDTTADLVKKAMRDMRAAGVGGLLLDLRNNPGGGLDVCIEVASQFVGKGPVVYIQERGQPRQPREATDGARRINLPLVVLINNGSASAAEILAGAIQDDHLGKLVGVPTFGKGLVQTVFPLRDGSALALTTARYLTPELRDIDHKGITPDVVAEQSKSLEFIPPLSEKDTQGRAGLDLLRQEMKRPVQAAA
jgi:carboxyl-terminal processing protease